MLSMMKGKNKKILTEAEVKQWYGVLKDPKLAAETDESDLSRIEKRAWITFESLMKQLNLSREFKEI